MLVADDDPGFREVAIANLEASGLKTAIATDGEEAVEQVKTLHPAAVLMDVEMPHKDGVTVVADLSADPATKNILTIFVTNLGKDTVIALAKKISFPINLQNYFNKDADYNLLMGKIRSAVAIA